MRGEVLSYDHALEAGLISGDDGVRYRFSRASLVRSEPPTPGDQVDFVVQGDLAVDLVVLGTTPAEDARTSVRRAAPQLDGWSYFLRAMTKFYLQGEGRARRSEYWWFQLFHWLVFIAATIAIFFLGGALAGAVGRETAQGGLVTGLTGLIWVIVILGFIIPSITVLIRRLHDMGQSGLWVLIGIVPLGGFALFIMTLMPSDYGPNRYGPHPL